MSASFSSLNAAPPAVYLVQLLHRDPSVLGAYTVSVSPYASYGNAGAGYTQDMIAGGAPPPVVNPYIMRTKRMYMAWLRISVPQWASDYQTGNYYVAGRRDVDRGFSITVPISDIPYSWHSS